MARGRRTNNLEKSVGWHTESKMMPTSLDSNRANITLIVLILHKLRSLRFPKGILILFGHFAKKMEKVRNKFSLIGVVDPVLILALITLVRVIYREVLVTDCSDCTDFAIAHVEDLDHVGDNEIEPLLPAASLGMVVLLVSLFEGVDPCVYGPPQLTAYQLAHNRIVDLTVHTRCPELARDCPIHLEERYPERRF